MQIGVVGLGYIGSVTAGVLAEAGNNVIGIEIDEKKLEEFKSGEPPIFEPGLKELLSKNRSKITFSSDYKKLKDVVAVFLTVPTPTEGGKINVEYIFKAAKSVREANKKAIIILKSTAVPGTAKRVRAETGATVISNPEFTKEGTAVEDTRSPDRVVIGGSDKDAISLVEKIWAFTKAPVLKTTNENAELIKYASNAFLATKISFINEIASLCEKIPGCDVEVVARGMGLDKRISSHFLKAGIGFGGSCFPKDTAAIASFSRELNSPLSIVEAGMKVNSDRVDHIIELLKPEFDSDLSGHKIGVLGLAFKGDTDDVRGSQAIKLVERLQNLGCIVNAYDSKVKAAPAGVNRFNNIKDCVDNSEALVVATEWEEFKTLKINDKLVIDGRRILDPSNFNKFKAIGLYG
jgi:UDPglucose 6-dehydrogenase